MLTNHFLKGVSSVDIFLNFFLDLSVINHGHIANAMDPNTVVFSLTIYCVSYCSQFFRNTFKDLVVLLNSHETIEVTIVLVKNTCAFRGFVLINSTVTSIIVYIYCTHMQWSQKQG